MIDQFTNRLLDNLYLKTGSRGRLTEKETDKIRDLFDKSSAENLTGNIIELFRVLKQVKDSHGLTPADFDIARPDLEKLAVRHQDIDEHQVSVGGRLDQALSIVEQAGERVARYLEQKDLEAPSGIQLWDRIRENHSRIRQVLGMTEDDWNSFSGQLKFAIESLDMLGGILNLPASALEEVGRVTKNYRMRLTPYYAGLIIPGNLEDPVLLQAVPTGEMVDNTGVEIPPVAADHSPARLIDQFYPRVVTIKATNMCAMYCTHCLRIAHIGKKDRIYSNEAYDEALDYIRKDSRIRDVLITGGDSFMLPNTMLRKLLVELDSIDHVRMKRLGTRIPVTTPQRINSELLDILEESNDKKPVRVVTQINTAQEITPVSRDAFKQISKRVSAVMNQAVLLKGINDTRVKMWKLCETIHEAYVRPYYLFNCSYRNPQFAHLRVPVEKGRDIVESMYGNISGDAIPRYIATAGGKIPLHRSNVSGKKGNELTLTKPWSGEEVAYPDADPGEYSDKSFALGKHK
ncbi:KamA family radical SAM protein [Desulfonatronovibrio hydrogenovorans]|uniref:KamA family radical SAM protein n=1 Tax=Desulfonatronovibrio hydrogenovorans TaxID=53245 RepID=UPI000491B529|nr:KamA family radical SAM protein [Desulfonatronovibrio hydrogenovorans]